MTLDNLNKNFIYISDKEQFGVNEYWEEMFPDQNGKYKGDCESYAITIKRNIDQFKDWEYYFCKLNGNGHCILVSKDGKTIIDNNVKTPMFKEIYINIFNVNDLRPFRWYELLWKFTSAKVIKLYLDYKKDKQ